MVFPCLPIGPFDCLTLVAHVSRLLLGLILSAVPIRFIRLYDNPTKRSQEKEEEAGKKKEKKRWRGEEDVKDSGEKEFIETYISSLKDRGEIYSGSKRQNTLTRRNLYYICVDMLYYFFWVGILTHIEK